MRPRRAQLAQKGIKKQPEGIKPRHARCQHSNSPENEISQVRVPRAHNDRFLAEYDVEGLVFEGQRTGLDTLQALRQAGDKTPVIMVTTEAEKSRVIEAIKAGANDYLIKPFSPERLAEKVKGVVGAPA